MIENSITSSWSQLLIETGIVPEKLAGELDNMLNFIPLQSSAVSGNDTSNSTYIERTHQNSALDSLRIHAVPDSFKKGKKCVQGLYRPNSLWNVPHQIRLSS